MKVPSKPKNRTTYDPIIPLLGRHLQECKSEYNRYIYTAMFTAALFTTAKLGNYPKCPPTDE
jgi:hypothetical protein